MNTRFYQQTTTLPLSGGLDAWEDKKQIALCADVVVIGSGRGYRELLRKTFARGMLDHTRPFDRSNVYYNHFSCVGQQRLPR